jgi:hypothetical protein
MFLGVQSFCQYTLKVGIHRHAFGCRYFFQTLQQTGGESHCQVAIFCALHLPSVAHFYVQSSRRKPEKCLAMYAGVRPAISPTELNGTAAWLFSARVPVRLANLSFFAGS